MRIQICINKNPELWGADADEKTTAYAAELLAQWVAEQAKAEWPDAEIDFMTRHEPVVPDAPDTFRVFDVSDDQVEGVQAQLCQWANDLWEDALEEAVLNTEEV